MKGHSGIVAEASSMVNDKHFQVRFLLSFPGKARHLRWVILSAFID